MSHIILAKFPKLFFFDCLVAVSQFFIFFLKETQNFSESMLPFYKYVSESNFYNTIDFLCFSKEKLFL